MARGGMTAEIQQALKGMDFPADKQQLVQQAKQNNASQNVIQTIQKLPEQKFKSPTDVEKAFGEKRGM